MRLQTLRGTVQALNGETALCRPEFNIERRPPGLLFSFPHPDLPSPTLTLPKGEGTRSGSRAGTPSPVERVGVNTGTPSATGTSRSSMSRGLLSRIGNTMLGVWGSRDATCALGDLVDIRCQTAN